MQLHVLGTMHESCLINVKHNSENLLNYVADKEFDIAYSEVKWLRETLVPNETEFVDKKVLWVVGAKHLPGLMVASQKLGATAEAIDPTPPQNPTTSPGTTQE
jgi:hypothetical protein